MENGNYYIGLDIGTDSVGYAVTDEEYNLLKFHGEPAWGTTVFDEASLKKSRRTFRSARRRLDRRQQRVNLLQELFASEISKADEKFFIRLKKSNLLRDDDSKNPVFMDDDYTDVEYYNDYPTIHHLICELMNNKSSHNVRLVYIACAWLVAHRGHFLKNISDDNLESIKDFNGIYTEFISFFESKGYSVPWHRINPSFIGDVIKKKSRINAKYKELVSVLYGNKKPEKEGSEGFPFNEDALLKFISGGTVKLSDLFLCDDYKEFGSVCLSMDDEEWAKTALNIGDDFEVIEELRKLYDWGVLVDSLGNCKTISEAKVAVYNQHAKDLEFLKYLIEKHCTKKQYNDMFRATDKDNYVAYTRHTDSKKTVSKKSIDEFSKYVLNIVKDIVPDEGDKEKYEDMKNRLTLRTFMPKQKTTDNRIIPNQLYKYELKVILNNACGYLPFLNEKDKDGLTVADKIISIFTFRIPYFVGPLNSHSQYAWLERKAEKIYPWNFDKVVDLDASENNFIRRLTNKCTYLPDCDVLPKDSLLYHSFCVLNEINNLKINAERIPVELKLDIYNNLFAVKKKVTPADIKSFLYSKFGKDESIEISGIDETIKSNLIPQIAFKSLIERGVISEKDAERIIERSTYAEDKTRLSKWLEKNYAEISEEDKKYICSLKFKDFGRFSRKLLCEIEGIEKETGCYSTIIEALFNTQYNFMELLSDKFTFIDEINTYRKEYYSENQLTLEDKLDEMYLSNSVKRSVYRTLSIVKDVTKAFGEPKRIFIETTRGGTEEQKGKRTKSRKDRILELYAKIKNDDVKRLQAELDSMGESADTRLQGDKLFLYFIQLGKCMYSGADIGLNNLASKEYDIDHIYPQAFVKDDSIINNKALVLSSENGKKGNNPIAADIRKERGQWWKYLLSVGLISEEKYKRLTRATPFSDEEKLGFINRQLTETSQSAKAVAALLKKNFSNAEIIYCKARLVSEFRQEFDLLKSRTFNDLHHATDAYLNIVTGNVYNYKFTRNFNVHSNYSMKTRTLFENQLTVDDKTIWNPDIMLPLVKKTAVKNNAHFTKFPFMKKGGFFNQQPVGKKEGLVPLKKGLDTELYGGYNEASVMFFVPVKYYVKNNSEFFIMSVELLYGENFLNNMNFATEYAYKRLEHILGKKVDRVDFPLGLKPWKINTVLSLDGFRVCLSGSSGGRTLCAQPIVQFSAEKKWQTYLKKLESFTEKCKKNPNFLYSREYDKVSFEENEELYNLYIDKLQNSIYSKRINSPIDTLINGKEKFTKLDIKEQCAALMNIHSVFTRLSAGGCDLSYIGGAKHAAATNSFSASASNWRKNYSVVSIVNCSPSGLWEKESPNLLELL